MANALTETILGRLRNPILDLAAASGKMPFARLSQPDVAPTPEEMAAAKWTNVSPSLLPQVAPQAAPQVAQASTPASSPSLLPQAAPQVAPQATAVAQPQSSKFDDFLSSLSQRLGDSGTNPLFQVGMGLLASGYDPNVNPYTTITSNLKSLAAQRIADKDALNRSADAEREKIKFDRELSRAKEDEKFGKEYAKKYLEMSAQAQNQAKLIR